MEGVSVSLAFTGPRHNLLVPSHTYDDYFSLLPNPATILVS